LIILGILVGAALLLGVIGYIITKRQQVEPPQQAVAPGSPPAAKPPKQKKPKKGQAPIVQPGLLPNGRPIPALLITSGPRTGERHLLFNGFLIGKQPGCNLIIEDGYTSSQHAQIGMDQNGICKLYDRGSTNGTYVNGVRITESGLQHGLVIRIGSTEMRFLAE
jgi:pSer/pThr/pTyr-binding forkhead associated (FHA) protein